MKKIFTAILLAAFAAATYGQQPNVRLQQLEEYLPTQRITLNKKQYSTSGGIVHLASFNVQEMSGWKTYFNKKEMGEEERQQRILTVNSRIAQSRQRMEGVIDYFRNTFSRLSKEGAESYLYEFHKNGIDTIKYSYFGPSEEVANFHFNNKLHKDNANGIDDYSNYHYDYSHSYTVTNSIKEMKPFDSEAFCAHIQPVLKKFMEMKGAKAYPVHWQHDEGFENESDFFTTAYYRRSIRESKTHSGLVTGTHYIIPSQYEADAQILYKELDALAYDYVNSHPEQRYTYEFTSEFSGSNSDNVIHGLPHIVNGKDCNNSNEFYLCCKREQDGNYHILTLNSKGIYWCPQEYASLKSYINGEKVYIKGMEPKKEKDKKK